MDIWFELLVCYLVVLCDSSISNTAAILVWYFSTRYYGICKHMHVPDVLKTFNIKIIWGAKIKAKSRSLTSLQKFLCTWLRLLSSSSRWIFLGVNQLT